MLSHLFKLIWNRKKANLLIMTEVAITFIVLFALVSMTWHYFNAYRHPLGYKVENTWAVWFYTGSRWNNETDREPLNRLVDVLRQQNEIRSVDISNDGMLINSQWTSSEDFEGGRLNYEAFMIGDDAFKNWGVKLNDGRWFSVEDDSKNYRPILVNQMFVDRFLKDRNPIGLEIPSSPESSLPPKRIVGVFNEFRQRGDFQTPTPVVVYRYDTKTGDRYGVGYVHITFDGKPPRAFEQKLMKVLKATAPQWEFGINSWADLREDINKQVLMPMTMLAIVVGFLMIMVAMGLFGILWQNINQRTAEIGLRRAIGASSSGIMFQIIGEVITLALIAMVFASVIVVQVPLLELVEVVTWSNFAISTLVSMALILLIVILCALYPGKVAVAKTPAVALHYE